MHWITADLLMFGFSVVNYAVVRKAALGGARAQSNNLAMFAIPSVAFFVFALMTGDDLFVGWRQTAELIGAGIVLSYVGNALSMKSVELAPNPGYSLVISKSYVVMTSVLAVVFFDAPLTARAVIAIAIIVACSALLTIDPKSSAHTSRHGWVTLAFGAFVCWGFLSLVSRHLHTHGVATLTFLTYISAIAALCTALEMRLRGFSARDAVGRRPLFLAIGIAATGFNFFNFTAIAHAPNVGYVNATNAASIAAVAVVAAVLFGDQLTVRKISAIVGVVGGLALLLV